MHSLTVENYRRFINPHWVDALQSLGQAPVFRRAKGAWLIDEQGQEWLDLVCSNGASLFGHHHPVLDQALIASLQSGLPAISPLGVPALSAELGAALVRLTGLDGYLSWLMSTGAEALECAVKQALLWRGRRKLLCAEGGFHGLSTLMLGLNGNPFWQEGLEAIVPVQQAVSVGDLVRLEPLLRSREYAAIVIEPIQATGGGPFWSADTIAALHQLCRDSETLLIVDEVQTGAGRCGSFTAMQALDWPVLPDILILSKGLTGGLLPLSVCMSRPELFSAFFARPGCAKAHGSTYAGNAHAVAVALAAVQLWETHPANPALAELAEFHLSLPQRYPGAIAASSARGGLHIIQTCAPEIAYGLFQQLYAQHILINPCMHAPTLSRYYLH